MSSADNRLFQQVLDALRQSEARYRHLIEHATDIIYTHTLDGRLITVNKVAESVLGYSTREFIGKDIQELIAPEHRETSRRMIESKLQGGGPTTYTIDVLTKEGQRVPLEVSTQIIYDEGEPLAVQGIGRDVTERQRAAEALARSERYFRALIENAADAVTIVNADGSVRYSSPAIRQIIGFTPEERRGESVFAIVHPDDKADALALFKQVRDQPNVPIHTVMRALHRDGGWRHVDISAINLLGDPDVYGIVVNWRDITSQVVAEQKLRDREHFYRSITERSTDILAIVDDKATITYISPSFEVVLGHKIADMIGTLGTQVIHPDDVQTAEAFLRRLVAAEQEQEIEELRVRDAAGHYRIMDVRARNLLSDPVIHGIVIDARDVTDRREAEQALRTSEERFRKIVETAGEGIAMRDTEGRFTFVNQRLADMLGYTVDELREKTIFDITAPEYIAGMRESGERRRMTGKSETLDLQFLHRDGSRIDALLAASPLFDGQGRYTGALGMVTDMTERKRLEEQLRQSQKIEAVGRLAGGVAHDFNNLLTAIRGHVDLMLADAELQSTLREDIEEIRKAADRAAGLTQQLLAFSRRQLLQPVVLEFDSIVREMESLLRRLITEDIELITELDADHTRVRADRGQIEQVLMNLVVNARDAIAGSGELHIKTECCEVDEEFARNNAGSIPGSYAKLTVRDTGVGMDPGTLSHVFEPFFTTKEIGKGTGLGLATVYGIVKQSGGYIRVESEIGAGTTFEIYLPRVEDPLPPQREAAVPASQRARGEVILVAEDEDAVRALASRILRKRGYHVLEARDGRHALDVVREFDGRIDILVTDVIMPHVGGRELSEKLAQLIPGVKVLYVSGYTDDALLQRGVLQSGIINFLEKPFTPEGLANKVREVLEA